MMKNLILILSVVGLFSCGKQERDHLTAQIDSLRFELGESRQAVQTLVEVGILMDSIDASRKLLRSSMVEGTTYNDYRARMNDINNYVKETERKIADLEKNGRKSVADAKSFTLAMRKLKKELADATRKLESMQVIVARYEQDNEDLLRAIRIKDEQLAESETRISIARDEILLLQNRFDATRESSRQTEAENYYARAQAVEETANRTKFAPRKKKESRRQALELYRLAFQMGKEEAQPRIEELEKKI